MDKHIIINVGRQFGSGGKRVAEALGEKLGIPVYDNELIVKAAAESGFSESLFKERDEKRRPWNVGNIFGANRYGDPCLGGLNDGEIFKMQSDVIRKIASEGSAIFVGRASDYVLRDMECLDVFVCAPMETRRTRIAELHNISEEDAEFMIEKRDKARAEYYNFFTFGHWGKASGYDLCIDSSLLGIEKTADFIIEFGRAAGLI